MLINNSRETDLNETELFSDGIVCINSKQWLFAYSIFKQLLAQSKSASVAVQYNMALCFYFAKEYQKAIELLDKATQKNATPSATLQQINSIPSALLDHEFENNFHLLALTKTACSLNTSHVKLRIRRLLVDIHLKLENWQEIIRLAQLSEMNNYQNVTEAVEIAKNKTSI